MLDRAMSKMHALSGEGEGTLHEPTSGSGQGRAEC